MNLNVHSSTPVVVCAVGLLAAFFMPWIRIFGVGISGYNLGQLDSHGNYAWIIPIVAGITILLSYIEVSNRAIGVVAGIIPLGAILYALGRVGLERGIESMKVALELAWQAFSIGAWLTIIFSIGIIVAALVQTPAGAGESQGSNA